jgi:hypothetical protein
MQVEFGCLVGVSRQAAREGTGAPSAFAQGIGRVSGTPTIPAGIARSRQVQGKP